MIYEISNEEYIFSKYYTLLIIVILVMISGNIMRHIPNTNNLFADFRRYDG